MWGKKRKGTGGVGQECRDVRVWESKKFGSTFTVKETKKINQVEIRLVRDVKQEYRHYRRSSMTKHSVVTQVSNRRFIQDLPSLMGGSLDYVSSTGDSQDGVEVVPLLDEEGDETVQQYEELIPCKAYH